MKKELLLEIKEYIEESEVMIDSEWGNCRNIDELIKYKVMPDLYYKVLKEYTEWIDK